MFRTRKRLIEVEVALARREAELELLRRDLADARTREREASEGWRDEKVKRTWSESMAQENVNATNARYQEIVAERIALSNDVKEERERRVKAETDAAVYRERIELMTNVFPAAAPFDGTAERKYTSEEEEDLQHALKVGLIDKKGLEAALEQAGLVNTEITLDFEPRDYPRLGGSV